MESGENVSYAVERLMAVYGDEIFRLCFLYLSDWQMAEDALQETFLKVYRKYHTFAGRSSEKTWLVRIAINVCKDYLRGNWLRRVDCHGALQEIPLAEGVSAQERDDEVIVAVLSLPVKYREVILLYYYWGMNSTEIARMLKRPLATVNTRLRRGRILLKDILEEVEGDE